jgi:hypothetical protein
MGPPQVPLFVVLPESQVSVRHVHGAFDDCRVQTL